MYFYNKNTGALHIEGYCGQSKYHPYHIKQFQTEKEAYDFAGQNIHMCKTCQKKRDNLLKKEM